MYSNHRSPWYIHAATFYFTVLYHFACLTYAMKAFFLIVFLQTWTLSKHDQRCQEDSPAVGVEDNVLPPLLGNQIETSTTGSTEPSKNNTRHSRKRTHLGFPEKSATSREEKNASSKKCKTVEGAEHISCNSLSLRTVESEVLIKKLERHSTCSKESVEANESNKVTSSKHSGVVSALKVNT